MKALVKKKLQRGLWLEDVPPPTVRINNVLIPMLLTGICGTDVHIYNWDAWASHTVPVPLVIGHEFVERVVENGSNFHDFKPGDIVSGEGHVVCGHFRNCLASRRHLCKDTQGLSANLAGAFAELLALPMTSPSAKPQSIGPGCIQHVHQQRHLWPRDVRDIVKNDCCCCRGTASALSSPIGFPTPNFNKASTPRLRTIRDGGVEVA